MLPPTLELGWNLCVSAVTGQGTWTKMSENTWTTERYLPKMKMHYCALARNQLFISISLCHRTWHLPIFLDPPPPNSYSFSILLSSFFSGVLFLLGLGIFFFVSFPSFFLLSSLSQMPQHLDLLTSGIIYRFARFEVDFTWSAHNLVGCPSRSSWTWDEK